MSKLLQKFKKQANRNKPLYIEAYKLMAATTEVIKMKYGEEFSPTAYFACLSEMLGQQISQPGGLNMDALMYCYSATVSMLDLGVIQNQQQKIVGFMEVVMQKGSPMQIKYAIMVLQFVLHSKTEAQWNTEGDNSGPILGLLLSLTTNTAQPVH